MIDPGEIYMSISYTVPLGNSTLGLHRHGINSLLLSHKKDPDGEILYSGGRDGILCRYSLGSDGQATRRKSVESHSDWINAMCELAKGRFLLTAGNDGCIHVHDSLKTEPYSNSADYVIGNAYSAFVPTIDTNRSFHTDYIKALCNCDFSQSFVSAGLDGRILVWDTGRLVPLLSFRGSNDDPVETSCDDLAPSVNFSGSHGSIYCLDNSSDFSLVAAAGYNRNIMLFDPRSGKQTASLSGHEDSVKSIIIDREGTSVLSASSDGTVRLWSIKTNSAVQIYNEFNGEPVWTLSCTKERSFDAFIAGGKSGDILLYSNTRDYVHKSEIIAKSQNGGVTSLAVINDDVWIAFAGSSNIAAFQWNVDREHHEVSNDDSRILDDLDALKLAGLNETRVYTSSFPIHTKPKWVIEGADGLKKFTFLDNRRFVVTESIKQKVQLWDIFTGRELQFPLPVSDFQHAVEEMTELTQVSPNWCSVDIKTGQLCVTLEHPRCFDGETYADEIQIMSLGEIRLTTGKLILHALYGSWVNQVRSSLALENDRPSSATSNQNEDSDIYTNMNPLKFDGNTILTIHEKAQEFHILMPVNRSSVAEIGSLSPKYSSWCPKWMYDCMVLDKRPAKEIVKLAFQLLPLSGEKQLEPLSDSKLTSNRLVRLKRMMQYVCDRTPSLKNKGVAEEIIEFSCQGSVLSPQLYLMTAKMRYSPSTDLIIHYGLVNRENRKS